MSLSVYIYIALLQNKVTCGKFMYLSTFTGLLESCVGGGAAVVLSEKKR